MAARFAGDRRQRFDESEQVAQIVRRHALHGRVGEGRILVIAVFGDALAHGTDELSRRPSPDSVGLIWRYVRHVESAEAGCQREAATEMGFIFLCGRSVAGTTTAGVEQRMTVGEIGRPCVGDVTRGVQFVPSEWRGQHQIASKAQDAQQSGES